MYSYGQTVPYNDRGFCSPFSYSAAMRNYYEERYQSHSKYSYHKHSYYKPPTTYYPSVLPCPTKTYIPITFKDTCVTPRKDYTTNELQVSQYTPCYKDRKYPSKVTPCELQGRGNTKFGQQKGIIKGQCPFEDYHDWPQPKSRGKGGKNWGKKHWEKPWQKPWDWIEGNIRWAMGRFAF